MLWYCKRVKQSTCNFWSKHICLSYFLSSIKVLIFHHLCFIRLFTCLSLVKEEIFYYLVTESRKRLNSNWKFQLFPITFSSHFTRYNPLKRKLKKKKKYFRFLDLSIFLLLIICIEFQMVVTCVTTLNVLVVSARSRDSIHSW